MDVAKAAILAKFPGKDLGVADTFLNMVIDRDRVKKTLVLSQPAHIRTVLEKANMLEQEGFMFQSHQGALGCRMMTGLQTQIFLIWNMWGCFCTSNLALGQIWHMPPVC